MQSLHKTRGKWIMATGWMYPAIVALLMLPSTAFATESRDKAESQQIEELRALVLRLQDRVDRMERQLNDRRSIEPSARNIVAVSGSPDNSLPVHGPAAITNNPTQIALNAAPA